MSTSGGGEEKLIWQISGRQPFNPRQASLRGILSLAYIGDTICDLYVRTMLVTGPDTKVNELHLKSSRYVKASAQSDAIGRILGSLTEDELSIYRRGRNAHHSTVPKNAEIAHYRRATGFEAVLGYLYLCGRDERIRQLLKSAFDMEQG